MAFHRVVLLLFVSAAVIGVAAQDHTWQYYATQLLTARDDDTDEAEQDEFFNTLAAFADNPINLNAATRDDLAQLPFLSNAQIDAIVDFLLRYRPLMSRAELMMIPTLDDCERHLLGALTILGESPPRERSFLDSIKYERAVREYRSLEHTSKGELVGYIKIPFYTRQGDEEGYYGYKYKHWLRGTYQWQHVKVGFVASQDAGEPFFANKNKWGYDMYTAFLQVKKVGPLTNLVVGHYRIKAGLGLVVNSNLSFGKSFGTTAAQTSPAVVYPHQSRTESNYLQGAAATVALWRSADITLFGSYRRIDATLVDSSAIRTIVTSGYHRTQSELDRKHNATQTTAGAHLRYAFSGFNVGITAIYNHYNLPLRPYTEGSSNAQLYRMFYPAGQDFWNISVNYGYRYHRFRIEGETATGDCGRVATVNSLSWQMNRRLTLYAIYRYYPARFTTIMGQSFSEGGRNQNETGAYVGVTWVPSSRFSLSGYTDIAYFPWARYLTLGSSYAFDNLLRATYSLTPHSSLMVRYRLKARQRNGEEEGVLIYRTEQRLRIAYSVDLGAFALRTQADGTYCSFTDKSAGVMLYQTAQYSIKRFSMAVGVGVFDTKDYSSRIYIYEEALPYSIASLSFYGEGLRCSAQLEGQVVKGLTLLAKFGFTHYFDRETIGSSYQLINSSSQTDLELMVRWKF